MKGGAILETSKKKKIVLEVALALAVILAIMFVVIQLVGANGKKIETTLALRATESEIVGADAYLVRDEHVIYSSGSGVVEYAAKDGEKLSVGSLAAQVHSVTGISLAELQSLIDTIDRAIRIFEESNIGVGASYGDVKKMREEMDELFYEVAALAQTGGGKQISDMLDELLVLMNQYRVATDKGTNFSEQIIALREQKSDLLNTYRTATHSVSADKSGYFYGGVDGYESLLGCERLETLTYDEFSSLLEVSPKADERAVGKIVASYNWYVVISVDQSVADKFSDEVGTVYPVTFTENSDRVIEMEIYRKIDHNGGALIIFMSDVMPTDFDYLRLQNVNVTLSEHSGYRVPSEAIAERDGEIGVWTVDANREVHFKKIKTLYVSDAYAIVAENDGSEDMLAYLRVNDIMIVSGRDIYEGKVIG